MANINISMRTPLVFAPSEIDWSRKRTFTVLSSDHEINPCYCPSGQQGGGGYLMDMGWWPDQCQTHTKTTTVRCYSITFHRMNFNLELHNYSCRLLTISSVKTPLLVSYSKNEFIISKPACCRIVSVFFAWKCIYEGGNGICPYNVHPINYFWDPKNLK